MINSIQNKLELMDNQPDGPPAIADDFNARIDANRDLGNGIP